MKTLEEQAEEFYETYEFESLDYSVTKLMVDFARKQQKELLEALKLYVSSGAGPTEAMQKAKAAIEKTQKL